jgi:hypothetical protein
MFTGAQASTIIYPPHLIDCVIVSSSHPQNKNQRDHHEGIQSGIDSRASLYNVTFNLQDCLQSYPCHLIITICLSQTLMPLCPRATLDNTVCDPAIHFPKQPSRKDDSNHLHRINRKIEPCRT